ncbi:MAG: hypothetical protein QM598_12280 [Protaetiibacter sp.]
MSSTTGRRGPGTTRFLAIAAAGVVVLTAVGVSIATGLDAAASVHDGFTDMELRLGQASRSSGPNADGVRVQSISTLALASIPGLSPLAIGLHLSAGALMALAPLAIAAFALLIGIGLMRGRPFNGGIARGLVLSSALLLACTVGGQLLAWASRAVAIGEFAIDYPGFFSRAPEFDPLLTATAVGLLVVAIAFRLGSRADRSTEGLV